MTLNYIDITSKYLAFYESCEEMPNVEQKLYNFLLAEVYNDLKEKGIDSLESWLKYYSTDGNNFNEIAILSKSYYAKILAGKFDEVTFAEKLLGFNAIAIYSLEMDVDVPVENTKFRGRIMSTLMEYIEHYELYLGGYLLKKGELSISDTTKGQFYTVWSADGYKSEQPITLSKP